jgi:AraC-like DNA-binding protein
MKNGQPSGTVWQVPYEPAPLQAHLDVELLSFARLRSMDRTGRRRRPQRPSFHLLALVEKGLGNHRRDFIDEPLRERSVVYLRPGVVHQWSDIDNVDGPLILFTPTAVDIESIEMAGSSFTTRLDPAIWALVRAATAHLRAEYAEYAEATRATTARTPAILRHALASLLLRACSDAPPRISGSDHHVFHAHSAEVEEHFTHWRGVREYARSLNYSTRTLTRATVAATGVSAKRFLDERTALEAKRLLAHTDMTVQECADALGFSQATNFSAFFSRITGNPPAHWRQLEQDSHDGSTEAWEA